MACLNDKNPFNTPGAFYVDNQCIACDACVIEASGFFKMNHEESLAYLYKQPVEKDEIECCKTVAILCPVDSIGSDGN